jgi:alkaline phosphatase D
MSDTGGKPMVNRRNVLKSVGTVGIGGISVALLDSDIVYGRRPDRVETSKVEWSADSSSEDVFPLSVMSGGPTDSGAILWTKVTEDAYDSSEPAYVQVSKKEEFSDPIYEGRIDSEQIKPENNHVIKTDLDGELPSDAHLYYRFNYDGTTSQTGRSDASRT